MHVHILHAPHRWTPLFAWILAPLLLIACGTTVHLTGTWTDPGVAPSGYHDIVVMGLTSNVNARNVVESKLVDALTKHKVTAANSLDLFPPNFDPKNESARDVVSRKIKAAGYQAVLTVSLVDKQSDTRYVPGTVRYAPYPAFGWYGNFWGYYGYMYGSLYSPGYYTTDKTYFLESNLYDLSQDGKLIWSGQSETYNPNSLESFATAYAKTMTAALAQGGLLPQ
ncbi:hypothetical protein [Chitinophaga sp. MM2321]|uniref:hypothetical protein n=1 Tax=Chitinophaga sp. MM2321 TaxID=3137178 RepID=UPI0032D59571